MRPGQLAALGWLAALPGPTLAGSWSGEAQLAGFGYVTAASRSDPDATLWSQLQLKHEARLGPLTCVVAARAEWWTSAERGPLEFDPADRERRRTPLSLREAWLRLPLADALDLEAGRLFLGWGKTDGYSPADAFLPRDATDPFADEKLPLWGVRLRGDRHGLRFDAFAAALTTPSRLPVLEGRFAPLARSGAHLTEGAGRPPATGFAALRLSATRGRWDLGAWARTGIRPAPILEPRPERATPSAGGFAIPADRRWAHETAAGVEAALVAGAWVLRGEGGWLHSAAPELGTAIPLSLSAERAIGDSTLLATLAVNLKDTPVAPALLFDRALLPALIVAFNRNEDWGEWKAVWTQGLEHGDGLVKLEGTCKLSDAWSLGGGIDWPFGSRSGPLGALRHARRARTSLTRRW